MRQTPRYLVLVLNLVVVVALSGCDVFGFHEWEWRQKLTIIVDTPYGPRTGSSVVNVDVGVSPKWWGVGDSAGSGWSSLAGEAVIVDLGTGRHLFALLENYDFETARNAFIPANEQPRSSAQVVEVYDRLERMRQSRVLPSELYPLLASFDDVSDPASARKVDPYNLEASFGPGYRLKSMTMSITDEPVTKGRVKAVLEWLERYYSKRLDGQRYGSIETDNPFANSLASGAFDTEKE